MNNKFKMTVDRLDAQLAQMEQICNDCASSLQTMIEMLDKIQMPQIVGHLVKSTDKGAVHWKQVIRADEAESGLQEILYLGAKDDKLIRKLAWKLYLESSLRIRMEQQKCVQSFLRRITNLAKYEKYRMRILRDPDILKLLGLAQVLPDQQLAWQEAEYQHNPNHPASLRIHAEGDLLVRSKTEALIVSELLRMHIAFRYECALQLKTMTVYPDFTIMHPVTGKIFYWEHFGMMDDSNYVSYAIRKMQEYEEAGYLPMHNFIMTYETKTNPLDYKDIRKVIEYYFLSK